MFKYFLELQYRLYFIFFNLFLTLCVSYFYKEVLLFLIIKPYSINDKNFEFLLSYFIFTNVTDVFYMYLKLVYFITTQIGFLYIFYHIFVFQVGSLVSIRVFLVALTVVALWWSSNSFGRGLGLGDLNVTSNLAAPLMASVTLRGLDGIDLDPENFSIRIDSMALKPKSTAPNSAPAAFRVR